MKRLFNYCFYRIALFYKKHLPLEDYITQGHTILISALGFYFIALVNILLPLFRVGMSKELIIIIIIPFCVMIFFNNRIFPNSKELFKEQQKKNKNEKAGWIKGLLVFLFLIGSIVSMVFSYVLQKHL